MDRLKRVVFLASGEGQLFEHSVRFFRQHSSQLVIAGLLTQNLQAGCVRRAKELKVDVLGVDATSPEALLTSLTSGLSDLDPDFILLTGFIKKIPSAIVSAYSGRIINSHPSLLPKFGGQGMYGLRVYQEVLAAGEVETGITLHLIDEEYDRGQVIAQQKIPVLPNETAKELQERVKEIERLFFSEASLRWIQSQK